MEITTADLKKISKKFKINEETLTNFIKNEERKDSIARIRAEMIKTPSFEVATRWSEICISFEEFEEIYIISNEKLDQKFFTNWLKSGKNYLERREILNCLPKENEKLKKIILEEWMNISTEEEEIREIMSYLEQADPLYKTGLKKIIKKLTR